MRRRRGLNSAILLLLFSRLRFNSRNPSKQELHPQTDPPNAASAASFNPKTDSAIIENALGTNDPRRVKFPFSSAHKSGTGTSAGSSLLFELAAKQHLVLQRTSLGCRDAVSQGLPHMSGGIARHAARLRLALG